MHIERDVENNLKKWLDNKEILIVRGPRQSGKTTILRRLKEHLQKSGISETCINFFTFEDDLVRMKFEDDPKTFIQSKLREGKNFFLLDEVQYVKDIGKKLKLIFDICENVKIIVTGSSSFDLTTLGRYLVGRAIFFDLLPFSFSEFLQTKGEQYRYAYEKLRYSFETKTLPEKQNFLEELNIFLHEYLTYGAYPSIVLEKDTEKKKELLKNLFATYIEKDIVARYGIKYRDKVVLILKALSVSLGNVITYGTLTNITGLNYTEIREILSILEDSYVITIVKPYYKNLLNELRKNPKIYFVDFGFRNHLMENFNSVQFDHLYENFVLNQLRDKYKVNYWRTTMKTEIDFILQKAEEIIPLEVKTTPKITRALRSFIQHYSSKTAIIVNLKELGVERIDNCEILTIPFVQL